MFPGTAVGPSVELVTLGRYRLDGLGFPLMTMCIGDGDGIVVPPYVGLALIPTVIISYSLLARYSVPSVFS